jgi:excisionase family DNA binding protein
MGLLIRPTPETSRQVRTREAALYLGVSAKVLRRLVREGQIPVVQSASGGRWLFDVRELDAYVERQPRARYALPAGRNGFDMRESEDDYVR